MITSVSYTHLPSNVDSTTVQVYLNDSRFNDTDAEYRFTWTNNIGGTPTLRQVYNQDLSLIHILCLRLTFA